MTLLQTARLRRMTALDTLTTERTVRPSLGIAPRKRGITILPDVDGSEVSRLITMCKTVAATKTTRDLAEAA